MPHAPVTRSLEPVLTLTGFDRVFEIHASRSASDHATTA